jgi:hypothetical protein
MKSKIGNLMVLVSSWLNLSSVLDVVKSYLWTAYNVKLFWPRVWDLSVPGRENYVYLVRVDTT